MHQNRATYYDEHDPCESITELAKHVWKSDLGKALVIGGGIALGLALLKGK